MKTLSKVALCGLLVLCIVALSGCGKKADENKPIAEVKAESEQMSVEKLRSMAMSYKDAIASRQGDVEKLAAQIKEIPIAKMLGEEAKGLKAEMDDLSKSMSALKQRFEIYYNKLKEKGGDTSGLSK